MDVLFVNSIEFVEGNDHPQIGQLILKKILSKKYDTDYLNFDYLHKIGKIKYVNSLIENFKQIAEYIIELDPKVVGFYTISDSFITTVKVAEMLKKLAPQIKIIFGGPHASLIAEKCIEQFSFVDAVAIGEGEKLIVPLIDRLINDFSLSDVKGICYCESGKIIVNPCNELISIDELNANDKLDFGEYNFKKNDSLMLEAGRGCPFKCSFCSTSVFWKRKYRVKLAEKIVDDMEYYNKTHKVTKFKLEHDMLTANKKYIKELCEHISIMKMDYTWTCSARIDCLDEDILKEMRRANCTGIYLGIETGSARMQKIENKNLNLENAPKILKILKQLEFNVTVSFIYGFYEENIEDFRETLKLMEKCLEFDIDSIQLHKYMALPGTKDSNIVYDDLYFDPEYAGEVSILYRELFKCDELSNLAKSSKEMFMQYYTFDNEVRKRYSRFDLFIVMLNIAMNQGFRSSVKLLVKRYGYEQLYIKYEVLFCQYLDKYCDLVLEEIISGSFFRNQLIKSFLNVMKTECKELDETIFKQIFMFEYKFYELRYIKKFKQIEKPYQTYKFSIDIFAMIKEGKLIVKDTFVMFVREKTRLKVMKINENQNYFRENEIEVFESDGWELENEKIYI
ncbi:B12-binding domain-containing radical SAM protein [Clostridium tunisiense]|uniref:B12-binding domain-containing radical SAM protein n=1 Tax=Clostridium tunisiense TaxID=219748 RepID=UPI00030B542B|nr:radical SAM protein [Clostridium tunisiense]